MSRAINLDEMIPCDVRLPPCTTYAKGALSIRSVIESMYVEGRESFPPKDRMSEPPLNSMYFESAKEDRWIAVDFDKTLAHYDGYKGPYTLGEPITAMVNQVRCWLAMGKRVCIFTARVAPAQDGRDVQKVRDTLRDWSIKHIGQALPITCIKHGAIEAFYDDKAVNVKPNEGVIRYAPDQTNDAPPAAMPDLNKEENYKATMTLAEVMGNTMPAHKLVELLRVIKENPKVFLSEVLDALTAELDAAKVFNAESTKLLDERTRELENVKTELKAARESIAGFLRDPKTYVHGSHAIPGDLSMPTEGMAPTKVWWAAKPASVMCVFDENTGEITRLTPDQKIITLLAHQRLVAYSGK